MKDAYGTAIEDGPFQTHSHPHSHFILSASALRIVVRIFQDPG
jgi:hypothetical protein